MSADDPSVVAWKKYTATEEYANSKRWAEHKEHAEGSLWAAFIAGWAAALATALTLEEQEMIRLQLHETGEKRHDLVAIIRRLADTLDLREARLAALALEVERLQKERDDAVRSRDSEWARFVELTKDEQIAQAHQSGLMHEHDELVDEIESLRADLRACAKALAEESAKHTLI